MPLSADGFNAVVALGQKFVQNPAARRSFYEELFAVHQADGGDVRFFEDVPPDSDLRRDQAFVQATDQWTASHPS